MKPISDMPQGLQDAVSLRMRHGMGVEHDTLMRHREYCVQALIEEVRGLRGELRGEPVRCGQRNGPAPGPGGNSDLIRKMRNELVEAVIGQLERWLQEVAD